MRLWHSLYLKIIGVIVIVLGMSSVAFSLLISQKLERDLLKLEGQKSALVADIIHETLDRDMMSFRADLVRHLIADLQGLEGILRVQVVRGDAAYVGAGRGVDEAFVDFKTLNNVGERLNCLPMRPDPKPPCKKEWVMGHEDRPVNIAPGVDHPAFRAFFHGALAEFGERSLTAEEEQHIKRGSNDVTYLEEVAGRPALTYLRPLPNFQRCALCHGSDHTLRGVLMVTTSLEAVYGEMAEDRRRLWGISLLTLVVVGGVVAVSLRRVVLKPIDQVANRLLDISEGEGDLTKRLEVSTKDEIGVVGHRFNVFVEKLHGLVSQASTSTARVLEASRQVLEISQEVSRTAHGQQEATLAGSRSLDAVAQSIREVTNAASRVSAIADRCAIAVSHMTGTVQEIAGSTTGLVNSVDETASSILEMSSSVTQVDEHITILTSATAEMSTSMSEMDEAINEIRSDIQGTVEFSKRVTDDSEKGRSSVGRTIEGIQRIQASSEQVASIIHSLDRRIELIGKIVNVIEDVADQTNLLALNASIIAAQAGEHGRGFAVVAQEIKELSVRTSQSTQEIQEIIKALQKEGRDAVEAIAAGVRSVEEGVALSREAGQALLMISESAEQSDERVKNMAEATKVQLRSVLKAAEATRRVNELAQRIAAATHQQRAGTEVISGATERMREATRRMEAATQAQTVSIEQIHAVVAEVTGSAREITEATRVQTEKGAEITETIAQVTEAAQQNVQAVERIAQAVAGLERHAEALEQEIRRFKL